MKLGPFLAIIFSALADQFAKASISLAGGVPSQPVSPPAAVPSKHILPIEAPDNHFIGPFLKEPAVPTVHGTIPAPLSDPSRISPGTQDDMLTAAIYAQNHMLKFVNGIVPNKAGQPGDSGSRLHAITVMDAHDIATQIIDECRVSGLDLPFAIAQIAKESAFDLKAENGNFLGSNPNKDRDGFDIGLCQLKIKYLIGAVDHTGAKIETVDEAYAMALDITRAIPFFAQKSLGLLAWANKNVGAIPKLANVKFRNPAYLAAGAYNFGTNPETGVFAKIAGGEDLKHCVDVAASTAHFAAILGLPNVFAFNG